MTVMFCFKFLNKIGMKIVSIGVAKKKSTDQNRVPTYNRTFTNFVFIQFISELN